MAYSVTKAAGVHLMKCLASTQGPKIRVNAILPGLLLTEWVCEVSTPSTAGLKKFQGLKYSQARIDAMKDAAALKQEVSLLCARARAEKLESHWRCVFDLT